MRRKVRPLHRTTRRVAPTEARQGLFERVGPLLQDPGAAVRLARDLHS
jgi:DNA-binding transcriptional LysR family regulator